MQVFSGSHETLNSLFYNAKWTVTNLSQTELSFTHQFPDVVVPLKIEVERLTSILRFIYGRSPEAAKLEA